MKILHSKAVEQWKLKITILIMHSEVKGARATKHYFTHYSCMVITLFTKGLCRSDVSLIYFRKLVYCFRLTVLSVFCWIKCLNQDFKKALVAMKFFSHFIKTHLINTKLFTKRLLRLLCVKSMLSKKKTVIKSKNKCVKNVTIK